MISHLNRTGSAFPFRRHPPPPAVPHDRVADTEVLVIEASLDAPDIAPHKDSPDSGPTCLLKAACIVGDWCAWNRE
jgi:hypothetical protein